MPQSIAVLYKDAKVGDFVAKAAKQYNFDTLRTDKKALYPRTSKIMRWLELCAAWCCGGWKSGNPEFSRILSEGFSIFFESLTCDENKLNFRQSLIKILWKYRESTLIISTWLRDLKDNLLDLLISKCNTLADEREIIEEFRSKAEDHPEFCKLTLGMFCAYNMENNLIYLSTLHSAKGREFNTVILFGMDDGSFRKDATSSQAIEDDRLFYVGFTRAKQEVHLVYNGKQPSSSVRRVKQKSGIMEALEDDYAYKSS